MIYHTKNPDFQKDIARKLDENQFFIVIRVYIYHLQSLYGLGPELITFVTIREPVKNYLADFVR